jgi:hypothetical protein
LEASPQLAKPRGATVVGITTCSLDGKQNGWGADLLV